MVARPGQIFRPQVVKARESICPYPPVSGVQPLEESPDSQPHTVLPESARVPDRPDAEEAKVRPDIRLPKTVQRSYYGQLSAKKLLLRQEGRAGGCHEEVHQESLSGILHMMSQGYLCSAPPAGCLEQRLAPPAGAPETGIPARSHRSGMSFVFNDYALDPYPVRCLQDPRCVPAGEARVNMDREQLPVLAVALVQEVEAVQQAQAVRPARDSDYDLLALLNQALTSDTPPHRPQGAPDRTRQRVRATWQASSLRPPDPD